MVFYIFVAIAALMVMNMLIGVLCEVVSAVAATETEELVVSWVKHKMTEIFEQIDEDGSGEISKTEFQAILANREAVLTLVDVGVDPNGLVDISDFIFDQEEDGSMKFGAFIEVILDLRGSNTATVKDVKNLIKFIRSQVSQMGDDLTDSSETRASFANNKSPKDDHGYAAKAKELALRDAAEYETRGLTIAVTVSPEALPTPGAVESIRIDETRSPSVGHFLSPINLAPPARPRPMLDEVPADLGVRRGNSSGSSRSTSATSHPKTRKLENFVSSAQAELQTLVNVMERGNVASYSDDDLTQLSRWASHMQEVLAKGVRDLHRLRPPGQAGSTPYCTPTS